MWYGKHIEGSPYVVSDSTIDSRAWLNDKSYAANQLRTPAVNSFVLRATDPSRRWRSW